MSVSNFYPPARNVAKCFSTSKRPPVPGKEDSNSLNPQQLHQQNINNYNSSNNINNTSAQPQQQQQCHLHDVQIHKDFHQTQNQMESSFVTPRRSNANPPNPENKNITTTKDDASFSSQRSDNFFSTTNDRLKEPLAPLGFEPEGSDSLDQNFQESSNSSGGLLHLKWTESFHNLMQDIDGVKLFKEYLKGDNFSDKLIDFHFACLGFKIKVSTDPENFSNLAKSIYKKFIKGDSMPLKSSVKKQIVEALKTKNINESIFDGAQAEIDLILKTNHYPAFLTSDIFIKFAETELENSKISSGSDSLDRNRSVTNRLETLMEDHELKNIDQSFSISSMSFISNDDFQNSKLDPHNYSTSTGTKSFRSHHQNDYSFENRQLAACNNSVAATSAIDSEGFTSDPMNDDAISFTSSSLDGREQRTLGSYKKHMQMMNKKNDHNSNNIVNSSNSVKHVNNNINCLNSFVIPRTQKGIVANVCQSDPKHFSELLMAKLNKLKADQDLQRISSLPSCVLSNYLKSQTSSSSNNNNKSVLSMLSSAPSVDHEYESMKCLEQHCSNIGEDCSKFPAYSNNNNISLAGAPSSSSYGSKQPGYHYQLKQKLQKYVNNLSNNNNIINNNNVINNSNNVNNNLSGYIENADDGNNIIEKCCCCDRCDFADSDHASAHGLYVNRQQQQQQQQLNNNTLHHHHHGHHRRHHKSFQQGLQQQQLLLRQKQHQCPATLTDQLREHVRSFAQQQQQQQQQHTSSRKLVFDNDDNINNNGIINNNNIIMNNNNINNCNIIGNSSYFNSQQQQQLPNTAMLPVQQQTHNQQLMMSASFLPSHQHFQDCNSSYHPTKHNNSNHNKSGMKRLADYDVVTTSNNINNSYYHHNSSSSNVLTSTSMSSSSSMVPSAILSDATNERVLTWMGGSEKMSASRVKSSADASSIRKSSHTSSKKTMTATSTTAANQTTTSTKSSSSSSSVVGVNSTVVGYYFCDESIPYRTTVPGRRVTLGQFKQLINKKGNFRYFFKTACSDFDDGVVHEEVIDDDQIVPMWENKILCRVKLIR